MGLKVSIVFITYNHEKYVERALRSVLEQETDFPFEVIVGEDCSTDSTRKIIHELQKEYPKQVKPLFREKNLGRPTKNVYETMMKCQGEYVAFLEGDDYWSDKHKLQKQVDFLEAHPEYIAAAHGCELIDENGDVITDENVRRVIDLYDYSGKFTFQDYEYSGKWPGHYATIVCRNVFKNKRYDYSILYRAHDFVDDGVILLFLLLQGDIYRMDDVMSAWRYVRKSDGGNWNSLSMKRNLIKDDCYLRQTLLKWVLEKREADDFAVMMCKKDFDMALKLYVKNPTRENQQFLRDMFDYNIKEVVMKGKKVSFMGYTLKAIIEKFTGNRS